MWRRAQYTPEVDLLGPYFTLKGREYRREDFKVRSLYGLPPNWELLVSTSAHASFL